MKSTKFSLTFCIAIAVVLTACSKPSVESSLQSARDYVSSKEYNSAVIEYKNVLLQQPRDSEVRIELGKLYLLQGQFDEAEKELEKALTNGASPELLIGALAASIYYQDDYLRVLNRVDQLNEAKAIIDAQSAYFYYASELKSTTQSKDSIALPSDKLSGDYLTMARAVEALANNNPDAALTLSQQFSDETVEPFEKAMLVATAHSFLGDNDQAILSYQTALSVYQTYYPLHFLLAERLISTRRIEEAETRINTLIELNPASAYANYLLSITELYHGNFEQALQAANLATQGGVNTPRAHFIAGVSAYQTDRIEAAYKNLIIATPRLPKDHIAQRLLAKVRLELGYVQELTESIEILDVEEDISAQIYALAAVKSYKLNDNDKADNYIKESLSIAPENPVSLLSKGLIQFERGEEDAINTLNRVIDIDPSLSEAWTYKAIAEYRKSGIEAAIAVTKEFQKTQELAGIMLEGILYLQDKKEEEAKRAFEQAYKLDPDNIEIGYYVMIANARSNESLTALRVAEELVNKAPNNLEVIMDYVNLLTSQNRDPMKYLTQRISKRPELAAPVAAKAYLLMLDGKHEEAILIIKESTAKPNYSTYMALGEALLDARRLEEAAENYKNWTQAFPSDSRAWYRYIITLQHLRKHSEALAAVEDALVYFPYNPKLTLLKAHFLVSMGETESAHSVLKSIYSQNQTLPEFKQISGTVAYNQGNYDEAFNLLNQAHNSKPTFSTAELLAYTYAKLNKPKEGMAVLEQYIDKLPNAYYERHIAAQFASNNDLLEEAIKQYEILDENNPDNFAVLNNFANVLVRANKIEKASKLAQQVIEMQPQSPYALSTFGLIKMNQGELDVAQRYVERALLKEPNNSEMLLQLTQILLAKNNKLEARTLLGRITPKTDYERKLFNQVREQLK
jgi:putative PEP-CTERM system TPR-repeat lipoprotein